MLFLLLFIAFNITIFGSSEADKAQLVSDRAYLQQQQQEAHLQTSYQNQVKTVLPRDYTLPETGAKSLAKQTFYIESIVLSGTTYLSKSKQKKILAPYLKRQLNQQHIQHLIRDVTNAYMIAGYVTTRVSLPKQNLKSKLLRLNVIEGRISKIQIAGQKGWGVRHCVLFKKEQHLNMRHIEASLAQLNRLRSNTYQVSLRPDKTRLGYSEVLLQNRSSGLVSGLASYSNQGKRQLYPDQLLVTVDQFLGFQEQWQLSFSQSTDEKMQQVTAGLDFNVPLKRFKLSLAHQFFRHNFIMQGSGGRYFHTFSHYLSYKGGLSFVCFNFPRHALTLNASYQEKENKRYLENTFLLNRHQLLKILDLSADIVYRPSWGTLTFSPSWRYGQTRFPSYTQDAALGAEPKASFEVYKLNLVYQKSFYVKQKYQHLSLSLTGFYSDRALVGTEQFSLGDQYTVRGFDGFLQGDKGYQYRLSYAMPLTVYINPSLAFEGGEVLSYESGQVQGDLLSVVLTQSMFYHQWSFSLSYSQGLRAPKGVEKAKKVYFNVALSF
eukprot:COSAG01_NODE_1135_length_11553_cov_40.402305_5_plen_548_part_00